MNRPVDRPSGTARAGGDGCTRFADRGHAGALLAARVGEERQRLGLTDPVVLGLARGGVPVAAAVAAALHAPLDVAVARKIGAPGRPELGLGAVTAVGPAQYDRANLRRLKLTPDDLRDICERERAEARRRLRHYRAAAGPVPLGGRDVLLVDDGLATGVTARAALAQVRAAGARKLVFAAPVCAASSLASLRDDGDADEVVCVAAPAHFVAVGYWYVDFGQTSDGEVVRALAARRS
jgi:predicted phosphoribosyltransferase